MNHKITLEIIEANRSFLLQSSSMALSDLANIHKDFDDIRDDAVVMSLALNDTISLMRYYGQYDKAIEHSQEILNRYQDSSQRLFVAHHLSVVGKCQAMLSEHGLAEETLLRVLEMAEKELEPSDDSIKLQADILHDLAMNADMSNMAPAVVMQYLDKDMQLLDGTHFESRKGLCIMGMGNVKYKERKLEEALSYYFKAAEIFDDGYNFLNLGVAYGNIALCYSDMGQKEKAEENLIRSHELRVRTGNHDTIAKSYHSLSLLYELAGDYDKAFAHMVTCRDYSRESSNKKTYKESLAWLEKICLKKNDAVNAALFKEEAERAVQG